MEPPPELVEELLKLCGIKDAMLLQQVLMRSNIPSLTEMLFRRGFAVEVFDERPDREAGDISAASFLTDCGDQGKHEQQRARSGGNGDHDLDKANKFEDFIRGIDRAASIDKILNRPWGEMQTKPLLSRVCRLDGQNAALFLPVQDVVGAQERGRGLPDESTEWSFEKWDKADSAWKRKHEGTDIMFEALYLPCAKGGVKVYIFNRNVNNVSEEVAFLGELTVRSSPRSPRLKTWLITREPAALDLKTPRSSLGAGLHALGKLDKRLADKGRPNATRAGGRSGI